MSRILFLLLSAALTGAAVAQNSRPAAQSQRDAIRVTAYSSGVFQLVQGKVSARVNLQNQIAGCTTGTYDGADPKSRPSGGAANTRVIDLVQKRGFWYLTFQAILGSGCNVQGLCGAGSAISLVWLELNSTLQVLSQQTEALEDCFSNTYLTRWSGKNRDDAPDTDDPTLELRGGVLEVSTEKSDYDTKLDTLTTVRYQRAFPEKGLVILVKKVAQK